MHEILLTLEFIFGHEKGKKTERVQYSYKFCSRLRLSINPSRPKREKIKACVRYFSSNFFYFLIN